jgi:hypothetical protein
VEFSIGEDARGIFGGVEDAPDDSVVGGNVVAFEPEEDVGFPAQGADFNDLIEAEEM